MLGARGGYQNSHFLASCGVGQSCVKLRGSVLGLTLSNITGSVAGNHRGLVQSTMYSPLTGFPILCINAPLAITGGQHKDSLRFYLKCMQVHLNQYMTG